MRLLKGRPSSRLGRCVTFLIITSLAVILVLTLDQKSGEIIFSVKNLAGRMSSLNKHQAIALRNHVLDSSLSQETQNLPEKIPQTVINMQIPNGSRIGDKFTGVTLRTSGNSSFTWRKVFHDIFDVADSLYFRLGPKNVTFKDKYVIYRCDNVTMMKCGGIGDRFRGIANAYLVANATGRVFKAEVIMSDCDFYKYILPNRVNWRLPVSFHKRVESNKTVTLYDMWANVTSYGLVRSTNWLHHWSVATDFLYMKSWHDFSLFFQKSSLYGQTFKWMSGQSESKVNRFLFQQLFRPTEYLQEKVVDFLTQHVDAGDKLICSQMRMGKNPTLKLDTRPSYNFEDLALVWNLFRELIAENGIKTKIFVMSDSSDVIATAKSQDFADKLFTTSGEIVHIELNQNLTDKMTCDGLDKVMLEFLVLPHCDVLVISDSGLSKYGAFLRNRDDNLFCFFIQGKLVPCTMDQITPMFTDSVIKKRKELNEAKNKNKKKKGKRKRKKTH